MSYSISITGHGATGDQVKAALLAAVNDLADAGYASGTASGTGPDGESFQHTASPGDGRQATDATDATDAAQTVTDGPHLEAGQREGGTSTSTDPDLAGADVVPAEGSDQPAPPASDQAPYGTPAP